MTTDKQRAIQKIVLEIIKGSARWFSGVTGERLITEDEAETHAKALAEVCREYTRRIMEVLK